MHYYLVILFFIILYNIKKKKYIKYTVPLIIKTHKNSHFQIIPLLNLDAYHLLWLSTQLPPSHHAALQLMFLMGKFVI